MLCQAFKIIGRRLVKREEERERESKGRIKGLCQRIHFELKFKSETCRRASNALKRVT